MKGVQRIYLPTGDQVSISICPSCLGDVYCGENNQVVLNMNADPSGSPSSSSMTVPNELAAAPHGEDSDSIRTERAQKSESYSLAGTISIHCGFAEAPTIFWCIPVEQIG